MIDRYPLDIPGGSKLSFEGWMVGWAGAAGAVGELGAAGGVGAAGAVGVVLG